MKMISIALRSFCGRVTATRLSLLNAQLLGKAPDAVRKYSVASVASIKTKSDIPGTVPATLEVIRADVAARERLKYETLNGYVESLNEPITTENVSFLYNCIGRCLPQVSAELKLELIDKLWTKVKQWKSPGQAEYVAWMGALRESGAVVAWEDLNKELQHLEPTMVLYEEFLYLISSYGPPEESVKVLDQIRKEDFPLTEKIFNALIIAHSRDKNVESVESVLELMATANLTPNVDTQYEMARAYISNDRWDDALEVIDLADFSTNHLIQLLKTILDQPGQDEQDLKERIDFVVQKLPGDVLRHREVSPVLKNLMTEQIHIFNRPNEALQVLKSLPKPTANPMTGAEYEDNYGAFILKEFFETNQSFAIIKSACDFLVDDHRNPRAAFIATEMSLRRHSAHSMDLLRFVGTLEPLKPHYFWPLFLDECQVNGEQGVIDLIVEMRSLNVEVDGDTIHSYILPNLPLILKDIKSGIQMITEAGVKISTLMPPLLGQLLNSNRYEDFRLVLSTYATKSDGEQLISPLMKSVGPNTNVKEVLKTLKCLMDFTKFAPNTDVNGSFLVEMANVGKFVPLQGILTEMIRHKINISQPAKTRVEERIKSVKSLSPEMKTTLLDVLKKLNTDSSVPVTGTTYLEFKHPKDMNYAELQSHLAELEEKGLNTRGVLRKLLQLAVREKRYDDALKLKEKCDELAMEYSAGMLASCVDLYIKADKLEEAQRVWTELEEKHSSFVIDEHKAIDLAALLISKAKNEEAREVLRKRAKQKIYGDNNNKNVWNLLTGLIEKSSNADQSDLSAKSFLNFLVKHKYCRYSNTLLGPQVREWLLKKDLRKAVAEFQDIVKKHRKTPLNLELLTLLVGLKNGLNVEVYGEFTEGEVMEMISEVFKSVELVHGNGAAKTSLLFATAEGGTEKQVRKILMDPSVRIDAQALERQCEYLGRAGKTDPLFKLVKSSRGLSHVINEQQLWVSLFQTLAKQNHIEETVRLFDRLLEEDEIKVNKQIAGIVVDLLKRNNLELPSRLQTFNV